MKTITDLAIALATYLRDRPPGQVHASHLVEQLRYLFGGDAHSFLVRIPPEGNVIETEAQRTMRAEIEHRVVPGLSMEEAGRKLSMPLVTSQSYRVPTALDAQVGGTHYKQMPIQHAEFCQRNKLGWCESAAIKYLCRHGRKNGVEDLNKALHYIEILKQLEYPEKPLDPQSGTVKQRQS